MASPASYPYLSFTALSPSKSESATAGDSPASSNARRFVIPLLRRLIILAVAVQGTSPTHAAALSERHGVQCSETCSQYSSPSFLSPYLMRSWDGFRNRITEIVFSPV